MKTAILTSPEMAPAIMVHAGTTSAMSIGLVQGEPQHLGAVQASLEHFLGMPFANTASVTAMMMVVVTGLIVLTNRWNWRLGAMLIVACIGFYGLAALYAIQAVASMRH
jgi:type IV secretion system protein VirB2